WIGRVVDAARSGDPTLVAASAVAVLAALGAARGAGADLVGAQALGEADLVREAVVARRQGRAVGGADGSVLALGITADAQEVGAVGLHARGFLRARVAAAALDDALAL